MKSNSGRIEDQYTIEKHLVSTRSADAYKAIDKSTNNSVCLWRLRNPLPGSPEVRRKFRDRIQKIVDIGKPVVDVFDFGVDAVGVAYAVIPSLHGQPLVAERVDPREVERRFVTCVRIVDAMHSAGVTCGDLCGNSFWVDRGGDIRFVGILGSFDAGASSSGMLPPVDTASYMSPEQRGGAEASPASDVYSLAVLGYYIFSGGLPDQKSPVPLVDIVPHAPVWTTRVFARCFAADPAQRYENAASFLRGMNDEKIRIAQDAQAPIKVRREIVSTPPASATPETRRGAPGEIGRVKAYAPVNRGGPAQQQETVEPSGEIQEPPRRRGRAILRLVAICGAIAIIGLIVTQLRHRKEESNSAGILTHIQAVESEGVKQAIEGISEPSTQLAEKEKKFAVIAASDDPLSHAILVDAATEAASVEERHLAEKAILDRSQRLGFVRSAEQVRQWLRLQSGPELPSGYAAVLKSLDPTLPIESQLKNMHDAYPASPHMILRLAAAVALDTEKSEEYRPILSEFLSESLGTDSVLHSSIGLILASSELALVFGEDAMKYSKDIPSTDLVWLLKILTERGDPQIRTIAALAMERNVFTPLRRLYISPITEAHTVPKNVSEGLMRATAGAATKADIAAIGRWYDPDAERVLLALCADDYPEDTLLDAFDVLAGRSLTIQPSADFVQWVRAKHWEKRAKYIRLAGVLGNLDLFSPREVGDAISPIENYLTDRQLMDGLTQTTSPVLAHALVEKFGDSMGLTTLLDLLEFPDADVRKLVVKGLGRFNDVGALKIIIDHYEQEKDPQVREVYESSFWVIRERSNGAMR